MVTYKNMRIPFMPPNFFNEMKADVKRNYVYIQFLYLILDYSHNHYTFKHFGV